MKLYESMGGAVVAAHKPAAVLAGIMEAHLIVDAIFGTGLSKTWAAWSGGNRRAEPVGQNRDCGRYPVRPRRPAGRPAGARSPGSPYLHLRSCKAGAATSSRRRIQGKAHRSRYLAAAAHKARSGTKPVLSTAPCSAAFSGRARLMRIRGCSGTWPWLQARQAKRALPR